MRECVSAWLHGYHFKDLQIIILSVPIKFNNWHWYFKRFMLKSHKLKTAIAHKLLEVERSNVGYMLILLCTIL